MLKRILDIVISIVMISLISPLFLVIAILIKLNDTGPVFFRGKRIGKDGKPFRMFKFRSMVVNADKKGGPSTAWDDPRLTPIGVFLRKYNLDELPQFINVLTGDMSIVGPRPEVEMYVDMFTEEEKKILTVKPGITDLASIWNPDEGEILKGSEDPEKVYMEKIRPTKIKLQLNYVKNHSLLTDFKIMWKSFQVHLLEPIKKKISK
jgi:lipopolysaccharide/colanic/teichoic acid biosynthesis glycosyltransferase